MIGWHTSPLDDSAAEPAPPGEPGLPVARRLLPPALHSLSPSPPESAGDPPGPVSPKPPTGTGDYGAFFRATLAPLRRYLTRLVGSREEAQDIAQDAYAKVYTAMNERAIEHPRALLYTTARHLAIDELKHRGRSPFREAPVDATPSSSPGIEAIVMAREEAVLLEHAINRLPEECRAVLLLRTGEHLTHEQVAARLGLTKKQAEKRLHRAVRLLHIAMNTPAPAAPNPFNPR